MQIRIIQVGKTKQSFFQEGEREYLKRLQNFAKIEIIQLKEHGIDSDSPSLRAKAIAEEGTVIASKLHSDNYLIVLDERGQQLTSPDFARQLEKIRDFQGTQIDFVIGGPFGLSQAIRDRANLLLSFSKFTFTHEQIRLLLLEQIYRASTILAHKTYHY